MARSTKDSLFKRFNRRLDSVDVNLLLGSVLCLTHAASAVFLGRYLPQALGHPFVSHCWPFFPYCHISSIVGELGWRILFLLYFFMGLWGAYCFAQPRLRIWSMRSLIGLTVFKALVMLLSYRSMGNYHFMPFVLTLFYVFGRARREIYILLFISFYIFAGLLKINSEWLSGASLGHHSFLESRELMQLGMAFGVFLEVSLVPLLLLPKTWLRAVIFSMLLCFHFLSYFQVGWFYPTVMFLLGLGAAFALRKPLEWQRVTKFQWLAITLFAVAQVLPRFMGDLGTLDGTRRLLSLNMYDARSQCISAFFIHHGNETIELSPNYADFGIRIRCDPILYVSEARSICSDIKSDARLDLYLAAKTTTGQTEYDLLRWEDFCQPQSKNRGVAW